MLIALFFACSGDALDTSATTTQDEDAYTPGTETDGGYDGPLTFEGDRPYNVLMISIDTFRPEELGFFGGEADTPGLDELLADSVVLMDHRSCSNWTFASVLCLQGGGSTTELGFVPEASMELHDQGLDGAPDSVVMGPEILQAAGWQTELITTNFFFSSNFGTAQGFDDIESMNSHGSEGSADEVLEAALDKLEGVTDFEPWYVHAHFMDPHQGYDPPDEYLDRLEGLADIDYDLTQGPQVEALVDDWDSLSAADQELVLEHLEVTYQGELAWVSDAIDTLLTEADAAGQLDHTLVVIWSDHGEELTEHGDIGHHVNLYDESNRGFAAFWAEGLQAQQYAGPTVHGNVWPTVLDVIPHAFENELPGAALGDEDNGLRFGQKLIGDSSSAFVDDGQHKLLVWSTGEAELYDLAADPDEQADLVSSDSATAASLWAELAPWIDELEGLGGVTWTDPGL